jgi:hypothetical protein
VRAPVEVVVQDDEFSRAHVWVRVLSGKVRVQPLIDGEPTGSVVEGVAGEQLQVLFPGAAKGVDNQRFFSAMEAEPEWGRSSIDETQMQVLLRYLRKPEPVPLPSISGVPTEVNGG